MVKSPNLVQVGGNEEKSEDAEEQTQDNTPRECNEFAFYL